MGKKIDAWSVAHDIYIKLARAGIRVLFDERDERAGVKIKDADLIGCPTHLTLGERGLQDGEAEVKLRHSSEFKMVLRENVVDEFMSLVESNRIKH